MHKVDTISDLEEFSSARGTARVSGTVKDGLKAARETVKKRHV